MKIEVHCADRTSSRCEKIVEVELEYSGLSPDDVTPKSKSKRGTKVVESIRITPPNPGWVAQNLKSLSPSELDQIKARGHFEISYDDLDAGVCDECGNGFSDEDSRH